MPSHVIVLAHTILVATLQLISKWPPFNMLNASAGNAALVFYIISDVPPDNDPFRLETCRNNKKKYVMF
jgi:hypothetical protein